MKAVLHWLWQIPGKKRGYVLALMLLQAVTGGIGVFYALLLRSVVDAAVLHQADVFWRGAALLGVFVLCRIALNALIRWLHELAHCDIENCFKLRLTDNILRKDYASVSAVHSGEWMNRLTGDTRVVADGIVDILPGLVGTAVRLGSGVVMIIALDRWFAVILLPGGALLIALSYAFRRVLKRLHKDIQETDGRLRIYLQESIGSLMMLKSFSAEPQSFAETRARVHAHKRARMRRNRFSNFCNVGFALAMQGMYVIGVVYCAYGILTGAVSYGTLTAVMQLIGQVQAPFANISGYLPRYYAMIASAERLMEIEAFADDSPIAPYSIGEIRTYYRQDFAAVGLDDASFTYYSRSDQAGALSKEGMSAVLQHCSLEIQNGQYVAFTGPSGCGKSTALKLFLAMYRLDGGTRYLRDRTGATRELSPRWRRLFAYVPQGNQLVSGSIREIVSFGAPDRAREDAAILEALRIACAEDFVTQLDQGIDTPLGERGAGLSEGQMQRIAIARAIFAGSPILLLDECTSALDEETEARLLQNLRSLTDRTVLIVTHRPAALSICDRVLRFTEDGIEES